MARTKGSGKSSINPKDDPFNIRRALQYGRNWKARRLQQLLDETGQTIAEACNAVIEHLSDYPKGADRETREKWRKEGLRPEAPPPTSAQREICWLCRDLRFEFEQGNAEWFKQFAAAIKSVGKPAPKIDKFELAVVRLLEIATRARNWDLVNDRPIHVLNLRFVFQPRFSPEVAEKTEAEKQRQLAMTEKERAERMRERDERLRREVLFANKPKQDLEQDKKQAEHLHGAQREIERQKNERRGMSQTLELADKTSSWSARQIFNRLKKQELPNGKLIVEDREFEPHMTLQSEWLGGEWVDQKRPDRKHTPSRQAIDAILKIAKRFGVKMPGARRGTAT